MTLKIGLMGCGDVARYGHLPAIHECEDITVRAVFDPNPEAREIAEGMFDVPHTFDDSEAFFQSGIDAVSITSPLTFHKINVLEAARHGLPVICEKPLAMNEAEGREMIAACEQAGVPLFVGFCYRFSPIALDIHRMIREGAIGQVRAMRLIYIWACHGKYVHIPGPGEGEWAINDRRKGRMLEGGPMVDCGVHQIDLARWWLGADPQHAPGPGHRPPGEVVRWSANAAWVDEYEAPDHVWMHLDHAGGCHSCVEMSYTYGHTTRDKFSRFLYEIIGTDGMLTFDREHRLFELRNHQQTTRLADAWEKNFIGMYEEFARVLREGSEGTLLASAQDALITTDLARQATEACIAQRLESTATPSPGHTPKRQTQPEADSGRTRSHRSESRRSASPAP